MLLQCKIHLNFLCKNIFSETESTFVDKKLSREDFFKEMRILFLHVAENISSGSQLLHWELIVDKCPKITSTNSTIDESFTREMKYSVMNKLSNQKLMSEYDTAQEVESSSIVEKSRDSENR